MKRLDPSPGDELRLGGSRLRFEGHPAVRWMVYAAEGRKAVVYRLRSENGEKFAFKVFKEAFQEPALLESPQMLRALGDLEGLRVARRRVINPSSKLAKQYPDTAFAVVMPWIEGRTWSDLLLNTAKGEGHLDRGASLKLAARFLSVLGALEERSAAHTDIAAGNVVLSLEHTTVELLDVEDAYLADRQPPRHRPKGSAGYQHPSLRQEEDCWCAEGDRFAAAILGAEIMLLSEPDLAQHATEDGLLQNGPEGSFDEAVTWLRDVAPDYSELLQKAWSAPTLSHCPPIAELHAALRPIAERASSPDGSVWVSTESAGAETPSPADSPVAGWKPFLVSWDDQPRKPTTAARPRQPSASQRRTSRGSGSPTRSAPQGRKRGGDFRPIFFVIALLIGLVLSTSSGEAAWMGLILVGLGLDVLHMLIRD